MASVGREGKRGELKRILYRDCAGKQRTIRLGECSNSVAETAKVAIGHLVIAKRHGSVPHADAVRWLEGIDDALYARVAAHGLCQPRETTEVVTLAALLDRFDDAAAVKDSTLAAYRQAAGSLRRFFGADKPVAAITPADADNWRKHLTEPQANPRNPNAKPKRLAPATVAKRVRVARTIFGRAVRWGMISTSPLADLRAGSQANADRSVYVPAETIQAVLSACPDDEWRAIVALCRFAGLRCPSEIQLLRWGDVNWARGRLTVRSPKTAGHDGHAVRMVPIAPEVRPILQDLFDAAEPGVEAVIPRLAGSGGGSANLRTQFQRIVAQAGAKPWPRLFHNLRASCATDWVERFPSHSVASWLGHSPLIAATHYLMARDHHFDAAAGLTEAASNPATDPATQARTPTTTGNQGFAGNAEKQAVLVSCGNGCEPVEKEKVGATGLEPVTSSM